MKEKCAFCWFLLYT